MRFHKFVARLALAVGMLIPGAATLSAQDWRDINRDSYRAGRLQADVAAGRARLNEDIGCGRTAAAARDARDLARGQRAVQARARDIRHDEYRRDWR
ncbi:MAG TPA: hypothetical protein VGS58_20710 [Candidatus Sulfopaludibacter sp.]|nr:hypothetical protein [Candidatus Sulfopaludibacter sp.]